MPKKTDHVYVTSLTVIEYIVNKLEIGEEITFKYNPNHSVFKHDSVELMKAINAQIINRQVEIVIDTQLNLISIRVIKRL
jgi:hypothetical protein